VIFRQRLIGVKRNSGEQTENNDLRNHTKRQEARFRLFRMTHLNRSKAPQVSVLQDVIS